MPDWSLLWPQIESNSIIRLVINWITNTTIIIAILKYAIDKLVTFKLSKAIEVYKTELGKQMKDYEQQLEVLTEEAKFKFNCISQDYILYGKDKYIAYIDIRKLLLDANSYVLGLRGLVQKPDFSKYSKSEAEEWLNDHNFGQFHKSRVLDIWDVYPDDAVKRINELTKIYDEHAASIAVNKLHNSMIESEVYLSEKLITLIDTMRLKLFDLLSLYKYAKDVDRSEIVEHVEKEQKLAEELRQLLTAIKAQIKLELSYAHSYNKNNNL